MQAVLLVGGLGTRLRPLTERLPKALVPLANRPLISYQLELLARHGVRDVILAVAHRAEQLREALGDGTPWGVRLTYEAEPEPWGTAGGLRNALPHLTGTFIATNGDLILDVDLGHLLATHEASGADATILVRRVDDVSPYGLVLTDEALRVLAFEEKQPYDRTGRNLVNVGVYVLRPELVERVPARAPWSVEYDLYPQLLAEGLHVQAYAMEPGACWCDVGRPATYLEASRLLLDGALPWAKPQLAPAGEQVYPPALLGTGVVLAARATVGPYAVLGDHVRVEPGAAVRDTVVGEGAVIGAEARLDGVIVGPGTRVAAGAQPAGESILA